MQIEETPCNLLVENEDLRRLQALSPSVTNGFLRIYQQRIPCTIRMIDHDQNQLTDRQFLTISIYERGAKNPDSLKLEITSEVDLFLNLTSTLTAPTYDEMRRTNHLNLNFKDYILSMLRIFSQTDKSQAQSRHGNEVELSLSQESGESSILRVLQNTEYKQLEILKLGFYPSSLEKVNQSILFRYNFKKAKLRVIENSISSIYSVLAQKNPSLLQFIQRTVGQVNTV